MKKKSANETEQEFDFIQKQRTYVEYDDLALVVSRWYSLDVLEFPPLHGLKR